MEKRLFLDTNVLLNMPDFIFDTEFAISGETLVELETIKASRSKSEDVRYRARRVIDFLKDYDGYEVVNYSREEIGYVIDGYGLPDIADSVICATALLYQQQNGDTVFLTNDISCQNIAKRILGLDVEWPEAQDYVISYKGFTELCMTDEEMAYFYEHQNENMYGLLTNEYLIIDDASGKVIDSYRWNGVNYAPLFKKQVKSFFFEKLKPKDIYQSCLIDSIMNNTITAVSAPAGAGKSLISLMVSMYLLESGGTKYDRLVVLHNPTKARGAADQGYYTGDATEKALQNSIGQMLATKFGDMYGVERLIGEGKLKIVSLADCRGMEIRDNEILYITECQNTTTDLIKLALSRVSSGAKVIIEGDYLAQTDSYLFEGRNNGLRRVIEQFKGHEEFGYVELQNIWRSKIAQLCELL